MPQYHALFGTLVALGGGLVIGGAAQAAVEISTQPTSNMSCVSGTCAPTATDAVLSTSEFQTMLASGSLKITSRRNCSPVLYCPATAASSIASSHTLAGASDGSLRLH